VNREGDARTFKEAEAAKDAASAALERDDAEEAARIELEAFGLDGHLAETNAGALTIGAPLTEAQIIALAELEHAFTNGRGVHVDVDAAEDVLHAFICVAMCECCCREPRDV
jgi:hypothetical protein